MAIINHGSGLQGLATTGRPLSFVPGLLFKLRAALIVRRQRRALMALDDRMLADIGVSRSVAYREANRPFMDLPDRMA